MTVTVTARRNQDGHIDGRALTFNGYVATGDDHTEVVRRLWRVLLADGTRALTRAGRWTKALQHAQQHKGIGQRLLDGRQVAILTHAATEDHDTATSLLADTDTPTPWEQAVAARMTVLCQPLADQRDNSGTTAMINSFLQLEPVPENAVFHTRLGLCVLDLSIDVGDTRAVAELVVGVAVESGDAYAAYDTAGHPPGRAAGSGPDNPVR